MRRNPALFAILVGGGIAGTLDILYAIIFSSFRGVAAQTIMQSVASGLLGKAAYEGGAGTAALGLVLHFSMALLIAAIFWFASRRLSFMTRHAVASGFVPMHLYVLAAIFYFASRRLSFMTRYAVASGFAYGVCVYVVMNFVVIPLSAFPTQMTFTPARVAINLVAHMILFGLPIALATRAASTPRT